jgi:hypothetical protein
MCRSEGATALEGHFFAYAQRREAGTSFGFAESRSYFAACAAKPLPPRSLRLVRE